MNKESQLLEQISLIREELKKKPENAGLLHDLGVGYYLMGEYTEAIRYLEQSVERSPGKVPFLFNLANAYNDNDQPEPAVDYYLQALDTDPNHIPSLNNLADCYERIGEYDKAHELFHYLTRVNGENPLSHFNLGNFFLRQNQHIEAAKCYEETLKRDEKFIDAYHNIAWILQKAKAYGEAMEYVQKGLDRDPSHRELIRLKVELNREV